MTFHSPATPLSRTAILTGPTASGKTEIALQFVHNHPRLQIEIINADSLLVYRGMDIGTAKPSAAEMKSVKHHLIDILEPNQTFTAGEFKRQTELCLEEISSRGHRALIVGGTGFYLNSLLFGLWDAPASNPDIKLSLEKLDNSELFQEFMKRDPEGAQRIGISDRYRLLRGLELVLVTGTSLDKLKQTLPKTPDPRFLLVEVDRETPELERRIKARTEWMIQNGLIDEYQQISRKFPGARPLESVGYFQVGQFLRGETPSGRKVAPNPEGLMSEIQLATRQLVKKQRTWFKNLEKRVQPFHRFYLDAQRSQLEEALKSVYE